jgi:hypothetical protein
VVKGEIEMESKIPVENPETERKFEDSIAGLTLRNSYARYLSVNTESLSEGSFFGE